MARDTTLEVRGKKIVGSFSSGKYKQRITLIITISSNGDLMPPFLIFNATKPRNKTLKDSHPQPYPSFGRETKALIERSGTIAIQDYSSWNSKYVMNSFCIPYYTQHAAANS